MVWQSQAATIEDLFFFLHAPTKKGLTAVIFGFMDSSNTHDTARIWSLCGFLGEDRAFTEFDLAWNKLLDDPRWPKRVKRFHTVDCVHHTGEFEGWSFAERLTMWGKLISLLTSLRTVVALGSVVVTEDFDNLTSEERELLRSEALGEPLDLSVQYIFQRCVRLTRNTSEEESLGILFDNENPYVMDRCYGLAKVYQTRFGLQKWFAGIGFGDSARFTPLQAADLLAYGTYRFVRDRRYPRSSEPDFPIEPGFLRMIEGILLAGGGSFDLDSMKKLAKRIKERHDGKIEPASAVSFLAPQKPEGTMELVIRCAKCGELFEVVGPQGVGPKITKIVDCFECHQPNKIEWPEESNPFSRHYDVE